jgi:putative ABC transport system permease protein
LRSSRHRDSLDFLHVVDIVMSGLLYEVQARDAATFAGATVGLALLLLFASLVPAWRATQVDPIVALRTD